MSYTYKVPKRKANRISYRILGSIFIVVALLVIIPLVAGYANHVILSWIFSIFLGMYGFYLFAMSFRKQAFDITYKFDDDGFHIEHKYGNTDYSYDDISYINIIIPDQAMIFYMLQIKAGKENFTIPFTGKQEYCEKIYAFVKPKINEEPETE